MGKYRFVLAGFYCTMNIKINNGSIYNRGAMNLFHIVIYNFSDSSNKEAMPFSPLGVLLCKIIRGPDSFQYLSLLIQRICKQFLIKLSFQQVSADHKVALKVITYVGCTLSLVGEALTAVAYCVLA